MEWYDISFRMREATGAEEMGDRFERPAFRSNAVWAVAALSYGYALYYLLLQTSYSDGPVLAAISVAGFVLLLAGSVRRIRKSEHYEFCAAALMVGYSVDGLYHSEEVLLSLFLLFAVCLIVNRWGFG